MGVEQAGQVDTAAPGGWASVRLPPLWLLALIAAILLLLAAPKDTGDVFEYHCYALDFWRGAQVVSKTFSTQCVTKVPDLAQAPFQELPREYGPLALVIFSLPLIFPTGWYNAIFYLLMCAVIVAIAWILDRYGPRGAGHIWLLYVLMGAMLEAAGRFDALVAAALLVALLASLRGRPLLAYGALAVGALLKFFPLALLPLLLIQSWRRRNEEPFWRGPALFGGIVAVGEGIALAISPTRALEPLSFMGARCVEVESFPATLGFIWDGLTGGTIKTNLVPIYSSVCQFDPSLSVTPTIMELLAGLGLLVVFWLVWRERLTLTQGFIFAIGLLILGTKVFSVQYLLWLSPLIAYEYGMDAMALAGWSVTLLATTFYYPIANNPWIEEHFGFWLVYHIPLLVAIRNTLFAIVGALAFRDTLRAPDTAKVGANAGVAGE